MSNKNIPLATNTLALADSSTSSPTIRRPGLVDYLQTWQAMQEFTRTRSPETADEIWLVEHPPVFTLGQAGKPEHLLADIGIPVVRTDRGGQVTYHGPGQAVVYLLFDLQRQRIKVRELVAMIEQAVIDLLAEYRVEATRRPGAPGVYVGEAKIAALGLRIRQGCCYHGLALNVDMDLSPFSAINPCGYAGLAVTQLSALGIALSLDEALQALGERLCQSWTACADRNWNKK